MNQKIIIGIVAVVVIVVIGGVFLASNKNASPIAGGDQNKVYCGSDGALTSIQPIQSHRSYCIRSNASDISFASNTPTAF
ncbi:MAG: hypothetical protein K2Q14_03210, partial [Gammaproteobacteria bacterium]|nr:hypothetical protein [Gammaproteobacteria bacterium]